MSQLGSQPEHGLVLVTWQRLKTEGDENCSMGGRRRRKRAYIAASCRARSPSPLITAEAGRKGLAQKLDAMVGRNTSAQGLGAAIRRNLIRLRWTACWDEIRFSRGQAASLLYRGWLTSFPDARGVSLDAVITRNGWAQGFGAGPGHTGWTQHFGAGVGRSNSAQLIRLPWIRMLGGDQVFPPVLVKEKSTVP